MRRFAQFNPVTKLVHAVLECELPSQQTAPGENQIELLAGEDPLGKVFVPATGLFIAKTRTKSDLEDETVAHYAVWLRWKLTREEAQIRGLAAGIVTALQAKEESAWVQYRNALIAWNQA